jgi:hypothetical protein
MTDRSAFEFIRPDEFAECTNGVLACGDLYERLWACVPDYKAPRPEVSEEPCYGMDSLAHFWDRFTAEEQATIIRLHDAQEAEYAALGEP